MELKEQIPNAGDLGSRVLKSRRESELIQIKAILTLTGMK